MEEVMAYLVYRSFIDKDVLLGCYKKKSIARRAQKRLAAKAHGNTAEATSWVIKKGKCPRWMTGKNRGDA